MKVAIFGDGAISQAISHLLKFNGVNFEICSRKKGNVENIANFDVVFLCIASEAIASYTSFLTNAKIVVSCAKGVYSKSQPFISKLFNKDQFCVLSGPNFASEIVQSQQTLTTVASQNQENLEIIKKLLTTPFFEVETTQNVVGVELCGILKNAIAIIMGYYGAKTSLWNEKSMILTKVFHESIAVMKSFGIDGEILEKSCGIGDIFLTCSSTNSRNYKFGFNLYNGTQKTDETVEGIRSLQFLEGLNLHLKFLKKPL